MVGAMTMTFQLPDHDKRGHILNSAVGQFMAYGYSRVTMDDIAQAASMSRPALYQFFRNKQDIYVAGSRAMAAQSLKMMEEVLSGAGAPAVRVVRAFTVSLLDMMAAIEATPHGAELISMKADFPSDWLEEWKSAKAALLAPVYAEAGAKAPLDGLTLARQLSDWLEGMKMRVRDREERVAALEAFVRMQFAAISR